MAKKKGNKNHDAMWAKVKKACRLSSEDIRMAKELGFVPKSLMKNIPAPTQQWKAPVKDWIRNEYEKRFGETQPAKPRPVPSRPPADRQVARLPRKPHGVTLGTLASVVGDAYEQEEAEDLEFDDLFDDHGPPTEEDIAEENDLMLRRQQQFRIAAEFVAHAFAQLPFVEKVVLFGSVAVPLKKEVRRFRKFRRARQKIWHECNDVDLAVWVSDLGSLKQIQKATGGALNALQALRDIGVAHHHVDVSLMEPATDRYLGRLCLFGTCPKDEFKPECQVPGCGESSFLEQFKGFVFDPGALRPDRSTVLFERGITEAGEEPFEDVSF